MRILKGLQPEKVFDFFEQISAIPHGSGNTKAVSDYLVAFAEERGLEHYQDALNNVVIIAPATPGYEQAEAVIIQGHMDMVCQKAPDCEKDMETEGLDLAVGEDYVFAVGTTLGADDGIAVAMALALLDSEDIPHPRLEAVITVDEEVGMEGAFGLDMSVLQGTRLLNIDSETEGVFTVGCAGGIRADCLLDVKREAFPGKTLRIDITGLLGGHSGAEIHKGRANANILMGRILFHLQQALSLRLISVAGGDKDNAIPTASSALLCTDDAPMVKELCARLDSVLKDEFSGCDAAVSVTVQEEETALLPMDAAGSERVIRFLCCAPNGVQVMSAHIPGLVQTSLNLGVLETFEDQVSVRFSVRSSIESQKHMIVEKLGCLTACLGGSMTVCSDYPGWAYRPDSPLRDIMTQVYRDQYGKPPVVEAIHAGLECGLFIGKRPGLDCVSFGPQIDEIHTFREKLYISSTQRTWELLLETLKRLK